jgi:hypothetical protein
MENALQHALKNAMTGATKQWFDDEPDTKPSTSTQEQPIVQAQQTLTLAQTDNTQSPERGAQVRAVYKMLVETPKVTCSQLEKRAKDMGYPWFDSISGQLKLLYDRGLVMRVKMPPEGTACKSSYRYWPIAMTLEEAMAKVKQEQERVAKGKASFSINKEKATKEKTVQRLVPKRKAVPTVEQFEQEQAAQPIKMLRVGVDPKHVVESLSVRDARAVYEELKKLFS